MINNEIVDKYYYEFSQWAIGDDFEELNSFEFMERWNEKHGDLLMLTEDGKVAKDMIKLVLLWSNQHGI